MNKKSQRAKSRVYEARQRKSEVGRQEYSFEPKISRRAKSIKRDTSIDEFLYKDAKRRRQDQRSALEEHSREGRSTASYQYMTSRSQSLFTSKIQREVEGNSEQLEFTRG